MFRVKVKRRLKIDRSICNVIFHFFLFPVNNARCNESVLRISAPVGEVITQAVIRDCGFGFPSAFLGDEARAHSYQRHASKLQGRRDTRESLL